LDFRCSLLQSFMAWTLFPFTPFCVIRKQAFPEEICIGTSPSSSSIVKENR